MKKDDGNKLLKERLEKCLVLKDLNYYFTLQELVIMTEDGVLEKWLYDNFFEEKA